MLVGKEASGAVLWPVRVVWRDWGCGCGVVIVLFVEFEREGGKYCILVY